MLVLILQMTSLIIKRQTIANMESDMDRWIQDRDRLSKQLEKCQMKYDNATVLQKVRIVWTSHIRFILTTALKCILSCDRNCFLFLVAEIELSLLFHNQEYLYYNNVRQKKKKSSVKFRIGKCRATSSFRSEPPMEVKIGFKNPGVEKWTANFC